MAKTYSIPENFIEGGYILHGTIKTRNAIEAVVFGGIGGLISLLLPISSLQAKITVFIFFAAPGGLLGFLGINNDPFTTFIRTAYRWRKSRKVMLYNNNTKGRKDDIVEKMLDQKTAAEVLTNSLNAFRSRGGYKTEELVEGIDFEFEEDTELTKYSGSSSSNKKKSNNGKQSKSSKSKK